MVLSLIIWGAIQNPAYAHCDTRKGPVVLAAREALAKNNVNLVLIWVQPKDEALIMDAFKRTMALRKINKDVQNMADDYFFETLVRIHRQGEGAAYTGLTDEPPEPPIVMADKAIERKSGDSLYNDLMFVIKQGLDQKLWQVWNASAYDKNNVTAGREYVNRYVALLHYVEALYQTAEASDSVPLHKQESLANQKASQPGIIIPPADNNRFLLLLIACLALMVVLMLIVLFENKRLKQQHYDIHNGLAQHLA